MQVIRFFSFLTLIAAPINLPFFYFSYCILLVGMLIKFPNQVWSYFKDDRGFQTLCLLNLILFILPLNFSGEAIRYLFKFFLIFSLLPVLKLIYEKDVIDIKKIYFIAVLISACIYTLEALIPIVPKFTFGDMTAAGVLGIASISLISGNLKRANVFIFLLIGLLIGVSKKFLVLDGILFFLFFSIILISLYQLIVSGLLTNYAFLVLVYPFLLIGKRGPIISFVFSWLLHEFVSTSGNSFKKFYTLIIFLSTLIVVFTSTQRLDFFDDPRLLIWVQGFKMAMDNPLGLGYGNADRIREYLPANYSNLRHFHSNYVNVLVENGFFGLAIFLLFLFYLVKRSSTQEKPLIWYFMLSGFFESNYQDSEYLLNLILCYFILKISRSKTEGNYETL